MYLYDVQHLERHTACYIHMMLKKETCACTSILLYCSSIFFLKCTSNYMLAVSAGNPSDRKQMKECVMFSYHSLCNSKWPGACFCRSVKFKM